jgi:alpha-L-rhamnosidase
MTEKTSPANQGAEGIINKQAVVKQIRFEHRRTPKGIGTGEPRISWIVQTELENWRQSACQLNQLTPDGEISATSEILQTSESVLLPWPFEPLQPRQRCAIQVRVWGSDGDPSKWSEPALVETGLLRPEDWQAHFITPALEDQGKKAQALPILRRAFEVKPGLKRARLYITALGVYEAEINGQAVGDEVLPPGWTSYHHRLRYQTHDITDHLKEGTNAIGVFLGDGWYRGRIGFSGGQEAIWGENLGLLVQLELVFEDGSDEKILTDQSWRASNGPILSASLYDGETYDARLEQAGWSEPGFNDSRWSGVKLLEKDLSILFAPEGPPVRRTQALSPVEIREAGTGKFILDFGQNLVGRLRIRVKGQEGTQITIKHAEVLENDELCLWPLRGAKASDHYILKGAEEETWEPRFTFHGFRYAEISGWPGELNPDDVQAVVIHNDLERTGWFECSDELLNRSHENVVWSMRGNFLSIPTDCPQRDERLGWTGDLQVFSPTASFLYDVSGFLSSWLQDLAWDQKEHGGIVPFIIPNNLPYATPAAAWGDAATVVPWVLYQRFGDRKILENQFESIKAWVDLIAAVAGENHLWDGGFQFGDWLEPSAPTENASEGRTDKYLVASAYFAHSADLLAKTAQVLGKTKDARVYNELAEKIRMAFAAEYITPNGRLMSDTGTAYSLAIAFALLPTDSQRVRAGKCLAEIVRKDDHHIPTGFVGTPLICDALCKSGYSEDAYKLLMQTACPSWLYPVTQGATTIWERWDAILPDGSIPKSGMLSFNHYAFGAVADWMHRTLAGLAPLEPGYREIAFSPIPGGGLTYAKAAHRTPYGLASGGWEISNESIHYELYLPPNTSAQVNLQEMQGNWIEVGSGGHHWDFALIKSQTAQSLTLDSTVGELMNRPALWEQILEVLTRYIPELENRIGSINDYSNLTLKQISFLLPNGEEMLQELKEKSVLGEK